MKSDSIIRTIYEKSIKFIIHKIEKISKFQNFIKYSKNFKIHKIQIISISYQIRTKWTIFVFQKWDGNSIEIIKKVEFFEIKIFLAI